ncbi:hypothetical protein [Rhodococcus sp. IEGM 1330]|uniref:hypothetical protein n=1 Tax=Rhodococcus sp. IEGM 1330 TaxID=3082225 RepID=UPI002955BCA6|nr:hypothetical protein [Rhodococcus sp. IEGM 1330]MDV8022296.1 hypothetical protein [Rhodococcus sp. IEGM 1330]
MSTPNPDLAVGGKVTFIGEPRRPYIVRATSENFAVLTRQADFKPKGVHFYCIIDWRKSVRGPCNLIGNGWDTTTDESCEELCAELETGSVEVSRRNQIALDIQAVRS